MNVVFERLGADVSALDVGESVRFPVASPTDLLETILMSTLAKVDGRQESLWLLCCI